MLFYRYTFCQSQEIVDALVVTVVDGGKGDAKAVLLVAQVDMRRMLHALLYVAFFLGLYEIVMHL